MEVKHSTRAALTRARHGKILCGVAQGIADHFDIDALLVRIIFIALFFLHGVGLLVYFILCLVLPSAPVVMMTEATSDMGSMPQEEAEAAAATPPSPSHRPPQSDASIWVMGIMLIVLGFLFLANNLFPGFRLSLYWPWLFIAIGLGILLSVYLNTPPSTQNEEE